MFNTIREAYEFTQSHMEQRPCDENMVSDGNFQYIHITRVFDIIERFRKLLEEKDSKYKDSLSLIIKMADIMEKLHSELFIVQPLLSFYKENGDTIEKIRKELYENH